MIVHVNFLQICMKIDCSHYIIWICFKFLPENYASKKNDTNICTFQSLIFSPCHINNILSFNCVFHMLKRAYKNLLNLDLVYQVLYIIA